MAHDPIPPRDTVHVERRGSAGRPLLYLLLAALLLAALAWALGLFNVDTSGRLEAPKVEVSGGEVPEVQVETAKVDVGTKETTIEVPTVEVQRPGDDGSARR